MFYLFSFQILDIIYYAREMNSLHKLDYSVQYYFLTLLISIEQF